VTDNLLHHGLDLRHGGDRRVHFIGIAGVGMSAVAKIMGDCGWRVTGSDAGSAPPISAVLQELGIPCETVYAPGNIPPNVDLIVIGKHEKLRPETNTEVRAAFDLPVSIVSYAEVLAELTNPTTNLVVAGSYAKSTITTLISWVLDQAGHAPSYMIGAVPQNEMPASRLAQGRFFVLEGDEYPSSNWDPTPKFLHYNPSHALLTSCEHDHMNVYRTEAEYVAAFHELGRAIRANGLLVTCLEKPGTSEVALSCKHKVISYSTTRSADYSIGDVVHADHIAFQLLRAGKYVCTFHSQLFGRHNVENILAASALVLSLDLVDPAMLVEIVAEFRGLVRRIQPIRHKGAIPIYEDIASSRSKGRASIEAIRNHYPSRRLVVVFQPYSLSFRDKAALTWYEDLFQGVDLLFLLAPPVLGNSTSQLNTETICDAVSRRGVNSAIAATEAHLHQLLQTTLSEEDVILVMSSGPIRGVVDRINDSTTALFGREVKDETLVC
jgi:UDP-N-acetylmuramate: L-alanyl-gamma-D-glutamyl-meso-diaminopimelate ligase